MNYEENIARQYTNGTETERLRLERLEPYIVGDLYEHGKAWTPWPVREARELRATARAILWDPNHVANHHGDTSDLARENCGTCELNRLDETPPNWSGWARIYVQAGATIPDAWRNEFAALLDERTPYAEALGRDIVTFGLREQRGTVRRANVVPA